MKWCIQVILNVEIDIVKIKMQRNLIVINLESFKLHFTGFNFNKMFFRFFQVNGRIRVRYARRLTLNMRI